jgi:hypothetical protein
MLRLNVMNAEQNARIESALATCLDECRAKDRPFTRVSEYITSLQADPAWTEAEIIELQRVSSVCCSFAMATLSDLTRKQNAGQFFGVGVKLAVPTRRATANGLSPHLAVYGCCRPRPRPAPSAAART